MADPGFSFSGHAGHVLFPRSPGDLTSVTQCPACFTALTSTICHSCGLDLNHPSAADLAITSSAIAELLDERIEIIGRMRFETAEALEQARRDAAATREAQAPVPAAAPTPAFVAPTPVFAAPAPAAPAPAAPAPAPEVAPRRRQSSIQVLTLIAGISLLSLAAVFFLIYAFVNFGIEWRSAIIATFTVATFTIASLLRRRGYTATAEGIAVFAVVLVYLDAYAVRANDLFGSLNAQPQVYWGVTLLGSALGFILWHRLSSLRVASVTGFAAVAPGAAVLLYGLAEQLDQPLRVYVSFAALAAAGLLHPLAARRARGVEAARPGIPERIIVLSFASVGFVVASGAAFVINSSFWAATIALAGVAGIALAHCLVALSASNRTIRTVTGFGRAFAVLGAVAAATSCVPTLFQRPDVVFAVIVPVATSVVVALSLDTLWRRVRTPQARGIAGAATIGALAVATISALFPAASAALLTLRTVTDAMISAPWTRELSTVLAAPSRATTAAVCAVAIIAALAIGFSTASGTLVSRRIALVSLVGLAAVLAVPQLTLTWAIIAGWFGIAALGLAAVILGARRWSFGIGLRVTLGAAALVAVGLGYLASWASIHSWLAGSIVSIALLVAARLAFAHTAPRPRAALLGIAAAIGFVGASALAQQLTIDLRSTADLPHTVRFVGIVAIALLALGAVTRATWLATADRRTLFWMSFPIAIVTMLSVWLGGSAGVIILPEYGTSLVLSAGLLGALLLWTVQRGNELMRVERIAASIAIAPAALWVAVAFARVIDNALLADIAPVISTILVAAAGLAVSIVRPSGTPRWARETGVAVVLIPAVGIAVMLNHEHGWLDLLLAGVTVLLLSISTDGLFASGSQRKHLGWLALILATLGLWWRLSNDNVADVEPFVLPVAGALLLIALLVWHAHRRATPSAAISSTGSTAAPFIALGALLVAILPVAVAAASGPVTRAVVIAAVSAVLALAGSWVVDRRGAQPYLDAAATAGVLGLLTVTIGRIALSIPLSELSVDAWLGGSVAVLIAAAIGQTVRRSPSSARSIVAQALTSVALVTALAIQILALTAADETVIDVSQLRVLIWGAVFAIIAMISLTIDRGAFRVFVGWVAVSATGVLVYAALIERALTIVQTAGFLVLIALVSGAVALTVTVLESSRVSRITREIGFASLALTALAVLPAAQVDTAWLVLEVAAVAALLAAINRDGLFAARTPRRHIGWLALAFAVAGLWWRLSGNDVRDVEPYVLPLAGALLLIALFVWRSHPVTNGRPGAAPLIVLSGLFVAIVPLGLNAATGSVVRPIVVGLVSAALLLVGSLVVAPPRVRPYLDAAAGAGAAGVLVVTTGRSWFMSTGTSATSSELDAWLAASLTVLIIAAFGQARARAETQPRWRLLVAQALGVAALSVVLIFEVLVFDDTVIGGVRALATVLVFCVVHVIATAILVSPFTRLVAWIAFGFAVIAAVAGVATGALAEIEYASVPLAIALIAGGLLHLQRVEAARSWPHLGPGLLVLLVPSLLAGIDDRPIWRIAAIAVVAIAATVVGLLGKLQAPFIIGAVVTIVHTITTFAPQLRELYEVNSWLVWIVIGTIGGTLLIVLAARFEKSLNTARSTLRRVAELR
ncbi:MAG: SCO7613 C-terminal domain-containing membrane protein [Microbacteriaceae bacterium]